MINNLQRMKAINLKAKSEQASIWPEFRISDQQSQRLSSPTFTFLLHEYFPTLDQKVILSTFTFLLHELFLSLDQEVTISLH